MKSFLKRTGLLCLLVILLPAISYAEIYSGSCGNNLQWKLDTETGLLEIYNSHSVAYSNMRDYSSSFYAPWYSYRTYIRSVNLSGINNIGWYAFYNCSNITSITIPVSVTSIGGGAFSGCSNLTSITIPKSVTSIGSSAFSGCSDLTSITIPESVTSIGSYAFSGCSGLTSIILPESVTRIYESTFSGCSGLTSITIPKSVTSIGDGAFSGCSGLISIKVAKGNTVYDSRNDCNAIIRTETNTLIVGSQNTIILNSVTSIGDYAFWDCSSLTSIIIPESVTSIGRYAFSGCSGLTSITIPESVTSIGGSAFAGCRRLTSIKIPKSVISIGRYAFSGCSGLTSITIPESVTSIGDNAFSGCSSLTSITIPESVTWIGNFVFQECSSLTFVELNSNAITSATYSSTKNLGTIFGNQVKEYIIGDNISTIGDYAFYNCSSQTSITIPESVTSIGSSAFYGCSGLTSVELNSNTIVSATYSSTNNLGTIFGRQVKEYIIGDKVSSIGDYAFYNCRSLTSIIIPESVTSIGRATFYGCSNLTSITIPESVTNIGDSAFYGCSNLTSITIPESVTNIGDFAFYGCSNLTSITIPESVTNIGDFAFSTCSNLTSITIPESVTSISNSAFYNCSSLTSITIPESVTDIGSGAFRGCSGLTSITIPESVTSIGNHAFYGCSALTSITIPEGVTTIKDYTYQGCSALTSITIPESVTTIGGYAFYGCSSLTSVIIPESVTSIGSGAFNNCSKLTSVTLKSNDIVSASRTSSTSMKSIFGTQVKEYVIGDAVKGIGDYAFFGCTELNSVTIPDNITSFGDSAFGECNNVIFYVNRGSDALLSVWNYGAEPHEIGTSQSLLPPSLSVTSTTQTILKCQIDNLYPELEYAVINSETIGDNEYMIKGLWPESEQTISLMVYSANNSYSTSVDTTTLSISPVMNEKTITASSISVKGSYTEGDAKVVSQTLILNGEEFDGADGDLYGLDPNTFYNCIYQVIVENDLGDKHLYETSKDISTEELVLITQQPKVISAGNVIVAANSNLDDEEAEVGFEWRRTDWTDDFNSNTGGAYLYDGTMEGYIRNLYTEKLWKYRPYYESNSGNRYYGDWVGIDPTNTSYFEPTIHTYATTNVSGNKAEVKGYAMRGTDNVVRQGFMYWKNVPSSTRRYAKSIPANAMVVEAKGNVMVATLENLDYDTEYCYVAFMTTSENETFYGEEQTFKTGEPSQDVIDGIVVNEKLSMRNEESAGAVYDLNGRKLTVSQKGINIIRMSDGTVRKVLIK